MKRLIISLILIGSFSIAQACTTFTINDGKGNIVFGRNFDFPVGMGHIEVNYRGVHKTAFVRPPEVPVAWVSKYGSITFNQIGREFPYGGMNEAGLVVEQMWLQEVIDSVAQENNTQWSIVYDISHQKIAFRSTVNPEIQAISMADFDFSCREELLFADMSWDIGGSESFLTLSREENLSLIRTVVAGVDFLRSNVPDEANVAMTDYAFGLQCID
ncbi:MAG: linear amide C-N hydrolase [Bacteroidales bacterium]|nr:linear amide C-N hydrolase [Bacteroidales bacterium]